MSNDEWELAILVCPSCQREKKMSILKAQEVRYTYCIHCSRAVEWERKHNKELSTRTTPARPGEKETGP